MKDISENTDFQETKLKNGKLIPIKTERKAMEYLLVPRETIVDKKILNDGIGYHSKESTVETKKWFYK